MSPLLEQLVEGFQSRHPLVAVIVEPYNTVQGIDQVAKGAAALAAVVGPPPEGMWAAPIAVDAIAVVVHPDNPLETLTRAQLYDVFSGRTWHWSDLVAGGRSLRIEDEITVLSRQESSGTRTAFEAQVMTQGPNCLPIAPFELGNNRQEIDGRSTAPKRAPCEPDPVTFMALLRMDSAAVLETIAQHPAAIGYVARGHLEAGAPVKALRIEGIAPTPAHIADGSYRISLPLYLVASQEPSGVARQFIDYCLSAKAQAQMARQYLPARSR
jgi:phosphate transport system substrate-binding protein